MDVDVAVVSMMFCDTTAGISNLGTPWLKKKSGGYPATEIGMTSRMP